MSLTDNGEQISSSIEVEKKETNGTAEIVPEPNDHTNGTTEDSAPDLADHVKEYYGKTLKCMDDLQTGACQLGGPQMPTFLNEAIKGVHEDVRNRYFGCGQIIPQELHGRSVLDLGCGTGMDCFVLSKLVGDKGRVTGVDMTEGQLEVANKFVDYHTKLYGYENANVDFVQGKIENLEEAGIKPNSFDVLVSNNAVNLCSDKKKVLTEAFNALKEGGEFYFSDVYSDSVIPDGVRQHKVLWGECIAGALWWEDLYALATEVGFSQPRLVIANSFDVSTPELKEIVGDLSFVSATYRMFKLPSEQKDASEVVYGGTMENSEDKFELDHLNVFKNGEAVKVGKAVSTILQSSRFATHFTFSDVTESPEEEDLKSDDPFEFAKTSPFAADASSKPKSWC